MNIPTTLDYGEFAKDENTAYISHIPLFGKVSSIADGNLESSNIYLTGFLKVTLKNGYNSGSGIKSIKVTAKKWNAGAWADAGADKPLSGNFDAVLDESDAFGTTVDGQKSKLQKGTEDLVNYGYTSTILVQLTELSFLSDYESLIYVPIVPGTYDRLQIDLCSDLNGANSVVNYAMGKENNTTGTAKVIKAGHFYANADFIDDNGGADGFVATTPLNKKMEKGYDLIYTMSATTTTEINDYLSLLNSTKGNVTVNINNDNALEVATQATQAKMNTIYIPNLESQMTLNIGNGTKGMNIANNDLTIADAAGVTDFSKPIIINITKFAAEVTKKVIINTKRPITLAGDFSAVATAPLITQANTLTLGTAGAAYKYPANGTIDVAEDNASNLVVANVVDGAANHTMTVNYEGTGSVAVNSEVKTVNIASTASSATIGAAVNTAVNTSKNITINVPYNATAANMTVGTLNIHTGVTAVTLQGGIIALIKNETTADTKTVAADNVTVTSSGLSAIKSVNFTKGKIGFTSSFAVPAAAPQSLDAFTAGDADNPTLIYTGAQLAAIGTTASVGGAGFKLATNITSLTNWQSPNLTKPFTGGKAASNGLTIAGVDAPLFGTVSADIAAVDLTVAIDKNENGIGGLAKINGGNVAITNVKVAGTIAGTYNVGGIFGTTKNDAANTINIGTKGTAANKVEVTATFTNKTNYTSPYNGRTPYAGTFGKFIGQAAANTTVVIAPECVATAAFDKAALHFDYNRIANDETGMNEWQFEGNTDYIGYSPNAVSLTYGDKEYAAAYTTDADGSGMLAYNKTSRKVTGTVYCLGVLYSPLTATQAAAIKGTLGGGFDASYDAATADWSEVTMKSHNKYVPFTAQ